MNLSYNFIDSINEASTLQLRNYIYSQTESIEHLQLNISSIGGSMPSAITIYNFLKKMPFKITTHNLGEVTSAAVILFLSGTIRTAEKISKFVIHPIKFAMNGDFSYFQVEEIQQTLNADVKNYASIVNHETNSLNGIYNVENILKGSSIALLPELALKCGIITQLF